jgi:hypothetical protein
MKKWLLVTVLALLSVGWLLPLCFAVDCLITWCEHEVTNAHDQHSFPYLGVAREAFGAAWIWLAMVGLFWSASAGRRLVGISKTAANPAEPPIARPGFSR